MSDREIVARALMGAKNGGAVSCRVERWGVLSGQEAPMLSINYDDLAAAVLAALAEAGRLVPEGAVCIDRERWDRVLDAAEWASAHTKTLLIPGDLDAEP